MPAAQAQENEPVDLNAIASDVIQDLERLIHETAGTVELDPLPAVQANAAQMRQLLQNLIGNALKFHHPDTPPIVRITASPGQTGTVQFCVSDNGIGFDPQYEDRIFEPFERLHSRDDYAGTGIGLALCQKIVQRHGGTIHATSRPGNGATFTVTLPATTQTPAHQTSGVA